MSPRTALDEEQVGVLVTKLQKNPNATSSTICDFACYPRCSHPREHKHRVNMTSYAINNDMPFGIGYKKFHDNNYRLIPVIPTGKRGDDMLSSALLKWMSVVDNHVKVDMKEAYLYLQHRFYFFHSTERIHRLFSAVLLKENTDNHEDRFNVLENQLQDHNHQIGQEKERVDRHDDQIQDHDRQIAHLDKKVRMLEDVVMECKRSNEQLVAEMAAAPGNERWNWKTAMWNFCHVPK
jgi:hypothetical protein